MEFIADGLLIAAAGTAALYCWVLSRKLNDLRNLDKGLGGAIASLSTQVEDTRVSLTEAKESTQARTKQLAELTTRAELAAQRLENVLTSVQAEDASPTTKASASRPDGRGEEDLLAALRNLAGVS